MNADKDRVERLERLGKAHRQLAEAAQGLVEATMASNAYKANAEVRAALEMLRLRLAALDSLEKPS